MNARRCSSLESLEARIAPATVYALEFGTNKIVAFDSASPNFLTQDISVTGLPAGGVLAGIALDHNTGLTLAAMLTDNGATRTLELYKVNLTTGVAAPDGGVSFINLPDTPYYATAVDPSSANLRLINDADEQRNIAANGGGNDSNVDEPNQPENIAAIAYDRAMGSAHVHTLFGYNYSLDQLVTVGGIDGRPEPSSGVVSPIAHLTLGGNPFTANNQSIGLDIAGLYGGPELGWLAVHSGASTHLYNVDLASAALTDLGAIGNGTRVFSSVIVTSAAPAPAIAGGKAMWTDVDGDLVTLSVSKGTLLPGDFQMLLGAKAGTSGLARLTLGAGFAGANVTVTAKPGAGGGDGAVNLGWIDATGADLGEIKIPGDLARLDAGVAGGPASIRSLTATSYGGPARVLVPSQSFAAGGKLVDGAGKITIAGNFAGALDLGNGKTGSVTIGGDLDGTAGGVGELSGAGLSAFTSLTIKGSVRGGDHDSTGRLVTSRLATLTIGGSVYGGAGNNSGLLELFNNLKAENVAIAGSVVGGDGIQSGGLFLAGKVNVKIGGDLVGGSTVSAGSIFPLGTLDLGTVTIGGSIIAGTVGSGIEAEKIGSVTVKGSVTGTAGAHASIVANGVLGVTQQAAARAIGSVKIGGSLSFGDIAAGIHADLNGVTADAAIGTITIAKDMIASSITAGIKPNDSQFGDGTDTFVGGNSGSPAVIARIASITIGGQLYGTAGGPADSFGIEAEELGALTVHKLKLKLAPGKINFLTGFTGDVRVKEF